MNCWGITDGSAGMVAQVKALAQALGVQPVMKTVELKKPYAYFPNSLASLLKPVIIRSFVTPASGLTPPWPTLVISCGRRAAMAAMGVKARAKDAGTRFIHIQDPQGGAKQFDLVVAMQHDHVHGPNVIKTRFALQAITPQYLENARQKFSAQFADYPKPFVSVLVGGSTNKYTLAPENMAKVVMGLQRLLTQTAGSLLITPSRRTGEVNVAMLRNVFAGNKRAYVYDFVGENPYPGMLALADTLIVTNDSVNMMSEAAATGKPFYILPLPGHEHTKPARFAEMLMQDGIARKFSGKLESWTYDIGNEMGQLAEEVRRRLSL